MVSVNWRRDVLGTEKPLGDHCSILESGYGGLGLDAGLEQRRGEGFEEKR